MTLYVKQKVFSWKDKFFVMDEFGSHRYYVEGEFPTIGKKLHVYDANDREVAFLRQKVFSFMPRFIVSINGTDVAEIVQQFTFLKDRFRIGGPEWEVHGSFMAHDYRIFDRGYRIAAVHKKWMSWGDSYEIDITDGQDETLVLAVILAIDCVIDGRN